MGGHTTSPVEFQRLTLMTSRQVLNHFGKTKSAGQDPGRVLVEASEFAEMLAAVGGFKLGLKALRAYSSPRLKLMEPPVQKDGKPCYVFPDHFNRLGIILTLRQAYNLPLATIRELLDHFPPDQHELIVERKFEIGDLLDLAKMLKHGYQLKDLFMAKGCDILLQDLMSSSQAVTAALEPGDTLRRLQEKLILGRLDEMKAWVSSGKWQEFVHRESAQDLKDLAAKQLLHKRVVAKVLAKKARSLDRG
ncbi:MAG: hypothetical protein KGO96_06465 [Elusimicrobia bacterium]|nr:hypothetical protein [Elusimicrobiota bacterium]MDE2425534.1 hypothetical protein [Elusimicrobiota bacterium]